MDKYRSSLIQVSQSPFIENQISMLRVNNILRTAKQPQVYVSSFPSNLVEPVKLGEKYAPDSCVYNGDLKYVWAEGLIKAGPAPFTLESKKKPGPIQMRPIDYSAQSLIIPELIVRNRPGVSLPVYQKQQSSILCTPKFQKQQEEKKEFKVKKGINKQTPKIILARKTKKASPVQLKADSLVKTKKRTRKSILKKQPKVIKVPEIHMGSYIEESPKKTVTWRESEDQVEENDYIKQTQTKKVERHKIPSYLTESKSSAEKSLEELERIVQEQQEYLKQQGMEFEYSENQEFEHKSEDEFEKEIAKIKLILNEQEQQKEFSPGNLEYSPDEAPEEASFDEWLSPRFPDSPEQERE